MIRNAKAMTTPARNTAPPTTPMSTDCIGRAKPRMIEPTMIVRTAAQDVGFERWPSAMDVPPGSGCTTARLPAARSSAFAGPAADGVDAVLQLGGGRLGTRRPPA